MLKVISMIITFSVFCSFLTRFPDESVVITYFFEANTLYIEILNLQTPFVETRIYPYHWGFY